MLFCFFGVIVILINVLIKYMFMFCRNCIDEGYGLCKLFFICKFFSNNNFMYFFFWNFCFYFGYT